MNRISKIFLLGLAVVALAGFGKIGTTNAAATPGSLIKMNGLSSVYYLGQDGKRYVFPAQNIYFSWYKDFSGVVTISQSELESYPLGANITMRPGTRLVKITTNPKVYAVEPGGNLRAIPDEATAKALYGDNWNKRVSDVADAFFTNYKMGNQLASNEVPAGSLVKNAGDASVYYFDGTNYRSIANEAAFNANRFSFDNVMTISNTITAGGTAITANEFANPDASATGVGVIPGQGTGLTVALSANTPASSSVPQNTSVNLLKVNLTAANDGAINVTGIKFTAAGLGNAAEIKQVTVYHGDAKLANSKDVDSNKVANINFSNALVIPAGQTVSLDVRATITGTGNYALSIEKAADIMSTGATVSGSFPITGNQMSGVNVTVGGLTIADDGSLSSAQLGDTQATLAKFKATADDKEDIMLHAITLKKDSVSSASDDSFENLKLYMDGSQVATSNGIVDRYVTFTFSNPVTIAKNNNKRFVVKGDIIDGANKTLVLTLDSTADVMATGSHYGYSSIITDSYTTTNSLTIDAGVVSIERVDAPNDKIMKDTTDVEFGTFKITANSGQNVELSRFLLTLDAVNEVATTTAGYTYIENVELFNKTTNSVYDLAYASGTTTSKVYSNTSMGLVLTSGVTYELVVRADVKSDATNQEYTPKIASAYSSATVQDVTLKETGNDTLISDITPNSVSLKKVTVQVPSVTFSKNALSASYSAVVGATDQEILNFNVKSGESSSVKVTELKFIDMVADNLSAVSPAVTETDVTNSMVSEFKLWKGTTLLKTVSASQLSSSEEITFSDVNETIPANTTVTYSLTTSLVKDSTLNGATLKYRLSAYSVEDVDGGVVYDIVNEQTVGTRDGVIASGETGHNALTSARTLTFVGTGALYVSMDNGDTATNKDTYSVANATTGSVAALKMRAVNEPVKVTKLVVTGSEDLNGIVTELALYDGTNLVGSTNVISTDNTIDINGDNLVVPMVSKNYYLKATLAKIGKDETGSLDKSITFAVKNIEAEGVESGDSLGANADGTLDSGEIGYDIDNNGSVASGATTGVSKTLGILASRISSVSLPTSVGGTSLATKLYSGQAANAAIIAVTADASSNTEDNGDAIKTFINGIKVKVTSNASSTVSTIERIGGTAGAKAGSDDSGYTSFVTGISGSDFEVMPGTTAYFLVKITPTFTVTDTGAVSINVSLDNMDHADDVANPALSAMANITWKDASTATAKSPLRLGVTTVDGTTISN